jgi:predicted permease
MRVRLQAALPLAVTSFVYAEEYKVHADIMSTGFVPLYHLSVLSLPSTLICRFKCTLEFH